MGWVRLDDTFVEDSRVETAGPLALALHVAALSYCNRTLSDGVVSRSRALRLLALDDPAAVIQALIDVGLWTADGDSVRVVDFHDWQPSRDEVIAVRAKKAERQRRWREGSRRTTDASTDATTNTSSNGCPEPVPARKGQGRGSGVRPSAGASDLPPAQEQPTITKRADGVTVIRLPRPAWSPSHDNA